MVNQTILRCTLPALRGAIRLQQRALTTSTVRMSEGATGGTRAGGEAQGDAFNKREKANEDYYVRQKEREKVLLMKKKLQEQRAHLDELDKHLDEMSKESGGEKN